MAPQAHPSRVPVTSFEPTRRGRDDIGHPRLITRPRTANLSDMLCQLYYIHRRGDFFLTRYLLLFARPGLAKRQLSVFELKADSGCAYGRDGATI